MSYAPFGPFTDVPQAQWGNPPAGAVALSAAALNHIESGLTDIAAQSDTNSTRLGQVTVNVRAYGAVGDGVTDDTAAIVAALTGCPEGGEVFFPVGRYVITSPLVLQRNRGLRGQHAPRWPYDTGAPTAIVAGPSFTGDALIRFKDEEELTGRVSAIPGGTTMTAGPGDQSGMWLTRMVLDGANISAGVDGIKASGLVRSVRLTDVTIRQCTGNAVHTIGYTRTGDGKTYYPRGWAMTQVVADRSGNNGFAFNLLNDSTMVDCLAVANTVHGFFIAGPGELLIVGSRSVFNKGGHGWYLTGTSFGNTVLSACSTDRNQQDGVHIDATGKQPIVLSGCVLRRDGRNGNGGGGSYAGLCVSGATAPVVIAALTTETGQDDDATGTMSPQYGMRVLNSASVAVSSGVLWGNTAAWVDGGGNTNLRLSPQVVQVVGSANSPTFTYPPDPAPQASGDLLPSGQETFSRDQISGTAVATSSGDLVLTYFTTRQPQTVNNLSVFVETAASGLTGAYLALFSVDSAGNLTLLAATANSTGSFGSTGQVTLALTSGQSVLAGQRLAFGVLFVGTTPPGLAAAVTSGTGAAYAVTPRMTGKLTGQSTTAASYTAAQVAATARRLFGLLLP